MTRRAPSARAGVRFAVLHWRVVLSVWLAPMILAGPLMAILVGVLGPALDADLEPGERWLLLLEALEPAWALVLVAAAATLFGLWAWTVLWHAGAARWQVWRGDRRPRLAEVLGLGVMVWWRFARLSLVAGSALALLLALVWLPVGAVCASGPGDRALAVWGLVGTACSVVGVLFVWLATLHAQWRLALPTGRSAATAWLAGAGRVLRAPVRSVATAMAWIVPASAVVAAVGVAAGDWPPAAASLAEAVASAVHSLCWVGLFGSFAPTAGVTLEDAGEDRPGSS